MFEIQLKYFLRVPETGAILYDEKIKHSSRPSSIQKSKTTVDLMCLVSVFDNLTKNVFSSLDKFSKEKVKIG